MHVLAALNPPGQSLAQWDQMGMLARELLPYQNYVRHGGLVTFLEAQYRDNTPVLPAGIDVTRIPHWRLLPLWPLLNLTLARTIDVIKTNQTHRATVYVRLAQKLNKPLVLRCGYINGEYRESVEGLTPAVKRYQRDEGWAFRNATLLSIPTENLVDWAVECYRVNRARVRVIPNFVDTGQFAPSDDPITEPVVVSVGRLHAVKRFDLLIEACAHADIPHIRIAGQGSEAERLLDLARRAGINLELPGQIPNEELPSFLHRGMTFVNVSLREGHPKALIEAMACGLPCVCTDSPGLRNVIQHEVNGLVVPPISSAIAEALRRLINDANLRRHLGQEARAYVVRNYDMNMILARDIAVLIEAMEVFDRER